MTRLIEGELGWMCIYILRVGKGGYGVGAIEASEYIQWGECVHG